MTYCSRLAHLLPFYCIGMHIVSANCQSSASAIIRKLRNIALAYTVLIHLKGILDERHIPETLNSDNDMQFWSEDSGLPHRFHIMTSIMVEHCAPCLAHNIVGNTTKHWSQNSWRTIHAWHTCYRSIALELKCTQYLLTAKVLLQQSYGNWGTQL